MNLEYNSKLQQYLAPVLQAAGYREDQATWRRVQDEAIFVFNIQDSQFWPALFVNLAVYFRALGTHSKPLEYECHLRTRLNRVVPDAARIVRLLDFALINGEDIAEDVRYPEIRSAVEQYALPWFSCYSTLDQARLNNPEGRFHVCPQLQEYLAHAPPC
jgi:hypothetical protein